MYTACSPESVEAVTAQRITDLAEIADFIPRMACKWEPIGTYLHQDTLVSNLKILPNCDPVSFCRQVLHEAKESGNLPNYATLLTCLKSDGVGLSQVATEVLQALLDQSKGESEHGQQPDTDDVSQPASLV